MIPSSAETVFINDNLSLEEYLCPPNRTLPPDTYLVLTESRLQIENAHEFCHIQNTSNITISSSQELNESTEIRCGKETLVGFGFFNVSNLTMESVSFVGCNNIIPDIAVRFINDTNHFMYYDATETMLILNHCYDVKLYDLKFFSYFIGPSIIGVNLCGHSEISKLASYANMPIDMLFYYTDSEMSVDPECNLNIEFDAYMCNPSVPQFYESFVDEKPNRIPIPQISGFVLMLTQEKFDVSIDVTITPVQNLIGFFFITKATLLFVNSKTNSHVVFQGLPFDYCYNETMSLEDDYLPLDISVVFYETPSFNTSVDDTNVINSITIQHTSLIYYMYLHQSQIISSYDKVLLVDNLSEKIAHQITLEKVSWCRREVISIGKFKTGESLDTFQFIAPNLLYAQTSTINGYLSIKISDVFMWYDTQYDVFLQTSQSYLRFINIKNITICGTSYFAANGGGSIMSIESSNLTITGDLTVVGGDGFQGGGMKLERSTLLLKEPLEARFYNNTAYQGSAIYVSIPTQNSMPSGECSIQILPYERYLPGNITDIEIALDFQNNINKVSNQSVSLYAPLFNFLCLQTSSNLNFSNDAWDDFQRQYTTLIDTIFNDTKKSDKFTSLSNGICMQFPRQQQKCLYIDEVHSGGANYLETIHSYPGERAISIILASDQEYGLMQVSCGKNPRRREKSEFKYHYLTRNVSTLSVTFLNKAERVLCFLFYLTNTDIPQLSFPLLKIELNNTCLFGFYLTDSICKCTREMQRLGYECNIDSQMYSSPPGYWTGSNANNNTISYNHICPPNYCDPKFQDFTLNDSITDLSCLSNRTGILCGQCKENYSAVFGSDACYDNCTDLYLLTLLMYAIAGLILAVLLFALRLTVATGIINGVIFYANILGLLMDELTRDYSGVHMAFFRIVISLLNLNLGFPLCFYKGMTTTAKVGFQFIFPVYLLSIIVGMIIISK